jgi:cytochrome c biogenesis protein CcmG, thiol:disulfide interchange protein DsbE
MRLRNFLQAAEPDSVSRRMRRLPGWRANVFPRPVNIVHGEASPRRAGPSRSAAAPALLVALVLIGTPACGDFPSTAEVGRLAPSYGAQTMSGEPVVLADLRGEVVLLNVWATWCYPCRKEMPSLQALEQELGDAGLRVVAVSIDRAGNAGEIRDFLEEHGITFTILHDPEQDIAVPFRTRGVPESWLIDREGVLVRHWIGLIDGESDAVRRPVMAALEGGG